ncbi:MAG: winged helix-turn-helix domain-containing protein [Bacillota bacterium]
MKKLIFSVEDDLNIQNVLKIALENSQFEIVNFSDAKSMFNKLKSTVPDLFLLDIMLPDIDGLEIIKYLKKNKELKNIPIMIISAKTSEIDKVIGIDLGADDYLIKPFGVLELVSRVKALLRRAKTIEENDDLSINNLNLDIKHYMATYKNNNLDLTKKQFSLLKLFMENHQKTLSREEILNKIWGYDFVGETRTLDVHIKEIRKKLKNAGLEEQVIQTIRGIGYKFVL